MTAGGTYSRREGESRCGEAGDSEVTLGDAWKDRPISPSLGQCA